MIPILDYPNQKSGGHFNLLHSPIQESIIYIYMTKIKSDIGKMYWHVHHEVLIEPLIKPLQNRIDFIKINKPKYEVKTRLRLIHQAKGKLPKSILKLKKTCNQAWTAYNQAEAAYLQAGKALNQARMALSQAATDYNQALRSSPEIKALHARECKDCPWDGRTIFPK